MAGLDRKLRVLVIGCTPLAEKIVATICAIEETCLVGVVDLDPVMGLMKANYCQLVEFARERPEDIFYTKNINDDETCDWIRGRQPDVIVQAGWSQIFKEHVLALPRMFSIGIHAAPLPEGRGAAIINWKLIEGGGPWGNTLFVMEKRTDTGDVLDFEPFVLEPRDDVRTAYLKVDRTAMRMIQRTLVRIAKGDIRRVNQKGKKASRYYKRKPQDGQMQFDWPAGKILDFVRALTHPFPGAFFRLESGDLLVWKAGPGPMGGVLAPGRVVEVKPGAGVLVQVGEKGSVWLTAVTPPKDAECWCDIWAQEQKITAETPLQLL